MSKPEWGVKRACPHCETRFYDLQKEPIMCPECGTAYDVDAHGQVSATRERRKPSPAGAGAKSLVDENDLVENEDKAVDEEDEALLDDDEDEDDVKGPKPSDEDEEGAAFKNAELIDEDEDEDEIDDEDNDLDDLPDDRTH